MIKACANAKKHWSGESPSSDKTGVLIRREETLTPPERTRSRRNGRKMATPRPRQRLEWMGLQAKECQGFLETIRNQDEAQKDSSPETLEGAWPCQHLGLNFQPPVFVTHPAVGICCGGPRKLMCPVTVSASAKPHCGPVWISFPSLDLSLGPGGPWAAQVT